eukprot:m.24107 g.24107  ORF g.24107 m.24107 type:complete len:200 (-) comp7394_c0_seq1:452-1051(-)
MLRALGVSRQAGLGARWAGRRLSILPCLPRPTAPARWLSRTPCRRSAQKEYKENAAYAAYKRAVKAHPWRLVMFGSPDASFESFMKDQALVLTYTAVVACVGAAVLWMVWPETQADSPKWWRRWHLANAKRLAASQHCPPTGAVVTEEDAGVGGAVVSVTFERPQLGLNIVIHNERCLMATRWADGVIPVPQVGGKTML